METRLSDQDMDAIESTNNPQDTAPATVGARLRAARVAAGLDIDAIAAQTRIPERHLLAIEESRYADMPGRTYILGFARNFARVVGLSETEIAADLRNELDNETGGGGWSPSPVIDVEDPARVPSIKTAAIIAFIGVAILLGLFGLWRAFWVPGGEIDPAQTEIASDAPSAPAATQRAAAPAIDAGGEVVFTARDDNVWVKFYDKDGLQLMQSIMKAGDQYTIPADAVEPMIWTGRPDALQITIGGKPVAPLGTAETTIKDVAVSAKALLARPPAEPAASADGSAGSPATATAGAPAETPAAPAR